MEVNHEQELDLSLVEDLSLGVVGLSSVVAHSLAVLSFVELQTQMQEEGL